MSLKNKGVKKFTFFYVVLLSAVVIISVVAVQSPKSVIKTGAKEQPTSSITYNLHTGWNAISIPFEASLTAKDLCTRVNDIVSVADWNNSISNWEYYDCSTSADSDNFKIVENRGYFLRVNTSSDWTVSGIVTKGKPYLTMTTGWNFAGLAPFMDENSKVSDVCEEKLTQGNRANVTEINRWYLGGWSPHVCSLPFNNYDIVSGQAYFVSVKLDSNSAGKSIPKLKFM